MDTPFNVISEELIPAVRRKVARTLYERGRSQSEISSLIGTSQAMVSKYVQSKQETPRRLVGLTDEISNEISTAALAGEDPLELTERLNIRILEAMERGRLCPRHKQRSAPGSCRACFHLSTTPGRGQILKDLNLSVEYLDVNPIPDLIPAVKVNIAQAVEDAENGEDVASFPGRISFHGGKANHLSPDFGVSGHLASILLAAMDTNGDIKAVINLRYQDELKEIIDGMAPLYFERDDEDLPDWIRKVGLGNDALLVDPGDFGIEPCLYVFGSTALDVVRRAHSLQIKFDEEKKGDNHE